jgi:hypothetical protein
MTREDWQYYSDVIAFMKPLFLLVKRLEGKPDSSANAYIANVLPAFDFMEDHIEQQLEAFGVQTYAEEEGGTLIRSLGHTNALSAQAKLLKYKKKNESAVLFAAIVLFPSRKWAYFKEHMTLEEFLEAKKLVQELWDTKYAEIPIQSSTISENRGGSVIK